MKGREYIPQGWLEVTIVIAIIFVVGLLFRGCHMYIAINQKDNPKPLTIQEQITLTEQRVSRNEERILAAIESIDMLRIEANANKREEIRLVEGRRMYREEEIPEVWDNCDESCHIQVEVGE